MYVSMYEIRMYVSCMYVSCMYVLKYLCKCIGICACIAHACVCI